MNHNIQKHNIKTAYIKKELINHLNANTDKTLCFKNRNKHSMRGAQLKDCAYIDLGSLNEIIEVNKDEGWVLVEPNISMKELVNITLKYGLIPPVVTESPSMTVGGAVQGAALESSSYIWGQFNDICLEYEIILGNGDIVKVSNNENGDLFYGISGSYGTLGILTLVKIKLIKAGEYVKLKYIPAKNNKEFFNILKREIKNPENNFVDGIIFSLSESVVMTGVFVNRHKLPVETFTKASDPWFWRHVKKVSDKNDFYEDAIPILDYLFRYDRGAFWMGEYAFSRLRIPISNKIFRYLFNPVLNTRKLYDAMHAFNSYQSYFGQDVYFNLNSAINCLVYNEDNLKIYPIWVCPIRATKTKQKLSPHYSDEDILFDIGIWGAPNNIKEKYFEINKEFEDFITKNSAKKMLYANLFFTKSKFWEIYDNDWYYALREKYYAINVFPEVWEKIYVSEVTKETPIKGIFKVVSNLIGLGRLIK